MGWQDGERIDQDIELIVDRLLHLHLGPVGCAEETWTALDTLLVDFSPGGYHAGRIPLHYEVDGMRQFACLHILQLAEMAPCLLPPLQLAIEEAVQRRVVGGGRIALGIQPLACLEFHGAQPILIEIVGIHLLHAQGSIAIAAPTPAEIQLLVDTPDTVLPAESQSQSIVFAIAGIGELYLAHQGSEECSWLAEL